MWAEILLFVAFFFGINGALEIEERIKRRKRDS
jgi:hypothetical protein